MSGSSATAIRPGKPCPLYAPGHSVHLTQSRLATERLPAELVEADLLGPFVIDLLGGRLRLWNHDVGRLVDAVVAGAALTYSPGFRLLRAHLPGGPTIPINVLVGTEPTRLCPPGRASS